MATDQKTRLSSDEALISGYIKKITNAESGLSRATKQATLASTKFTELQSKAAPKNGGGANEAVKPLEEALEKRRAELQAAKDTLKQLKNDEHDSKNK